MSSAWSAEPSAGEPRGVSAFEELLRVVERHAEEERETVEAYAALAERTPDPALRVLLELLIDDERKHHAIFRRIAARLRDDAEWTRSDEALPVAPAAGRIDPADRRFLESAAQGERRGSRELRRLARERADLNGGLISALVESMADDSDKHARILSFAARRVADR